MEIQEENTISASRVARHDYRGDAGRMAAFGTKSCGAAIGQKQGVFEKNKKKIDWRIGYITNHILCH